MIRMRLVVCFALGAVCATVPLVLGTGAARAGPLPGKGNDNGLHKGFDNGPHWGYDKGDGGLHLGQDQGQGPGIGGEDSPPAPPPFTSVDPPPASVGDSIGSLDDPPPPAITEDLGSINLPGGGPVVLLEVGSNGAVPSTTMTNPEPSTLVLSGLGGLLLLAYARRGRATGRAD